MTSNRNDLMQKLIMTGLMTAIVTISTMVIAIPVPYTQGYIHLGDSMIYLSVLILGIRYGAFAAAIGSSLADIFLGFAFWMPWTIVIKAVMAILMGLIVKFFLSEKGKSIKAHSMLIMLLSMTASGMWMVFGYYLAASVIYGNLTIALLSIPPNIVQFVVGFMIATLVNIALSKTPVYKYFEFKLPFAN